MKHVLTTVREALRPVWHAVRDSVENVIHGGAMSETEFGQHITVMRLGLTRYARLHAEMTYLRRELEALGDVPAEMMALLDACTARYVAAGEMVQAKEDISDTFKGKWLIQRITFTRQCNDVYNHIADCMQEDRGLRQRVNAYLNKQCPGRKEPECRVDGSWGWALDRDDGAGRA